jgi:hypothetical protein
MNHRRHLATAVALVVMLGACADAPMPTEGGALAPAGPVYSNGTSDARLDQLARFNTPPSIHIAWARKWIGPEGGRLEFIGFAIDVPPGAVSKRTAFSIHLPVDPQGAEHVLARFGPHGASFDVPVTIELPYSGTSIATSESATVVWWDGAAWVDFGAEVTADGERLRTTTDHFSEFGTTDDTTSRAISTSGG